MCFGAVKITVKCLQGSAMPSKMGFRQRLVNLDWLTERFLAAENSKLYPNASTQLS
jgi:hypothetical protein